MPSGNDDADDLDWSEPSGAATDGGEGDAGDDAGDGDGYVSGDHPGDDTSGEYAGDEDPWASVKSEDELKQSTTTSDTSGEESDTAGGGGDDDADVSAVSAESVEVPERPDATDLDWADMDALDGEFIHESVSCENCIHREVCVVLNSLAPMLEDENWDAGTEDDGSPIDPLDMAKICDKYQPADDEDAPRQEAASSDT